MAKAKDKPAKEKKKPKLKAVVAKKSVDVVVPLNKAKKAKKKSK